MRDYEEVTAFLGQNGPFFRTTFLLLNAIFIGTGFNGLYIVFVGATPRHRCLVPGLANLSEAWRGAVIPLDGLGGGESRCRRYRLDVVRNLSDRGLAPRLDVNLTGLEQEACLDGWSYSTDLYRSTIVTEWDLVCDSEWKVPFASSTLFVGYLFGSLVSGQMSDRFGRKGVVFFSLAAQFLFVFLQSFSVSWEIFCLLFLFVGASQISLYISAFVLGTEVLSKSMRVLFTTLGTFLHYCFGYMTLPWIAYAVREWRPLLVILSSVTLVYIPLWWFIPESPRWLLARGRVDEAEVILRRAARRNGVQPPEVIFKHTELDDVSPTTKATMLDVLRTSNMRLTTLMCLLLWIAVNIGYFGLSLNTSNLSGDPYLNCFLSAASEVPGYLVSTWLLKTCPRRPLLSCFLLIGGGFLLLISFIPETLQGLAVALEMVGKFGFTMAFCAVYIYTAELYPTVVRNVGIGMCSSAARIGSITAPYIIYLGSFNKSLPYILMGSLTVSSAVSNLFLPETFLKDLPETMDQMQRCRGLCRGTQMNAHILEKGGRDNPAVVLDNPAVVLDNPAVVLDNPAVVLDNPAVVLDNPAVVLDNPAVVLDNPVVVLDNPAVVLDNPAVVLDNPAVVLDNPAVVLDNPAVVHDNPAVVLDNPAVVLDNPVVVLDNPAVVLDNPAVVLDNPAVVHDNPAVVLEVKC